MEAKVYLNYDIGKFKDGIHVVAYYLCSYCYLELNYQFEDGIKNVWKRISDIDIKYITLGEFNEVSHSLIEIVDSKEPLERISSDSKNYIRLKKLEELNIHRDGY